MSEEPLGSDFFWSTIAEANRSRDRLREILLTYSEDELVWFHEQFVITTAELKGEPFLEYMVGSEDGVDDVADWVVSQGREYYKSVLDDPSSIPYDVEDDEEDSSLAGVASDIYYERYGKIFEMY